MVKRLSHNRFAGTSALSASLALAAISACSSDSPDPTATELHLGPEIILNDGLFETDPSACWNGQHHVLVYARRETAWPQPELFVQTVNGDGTSAAAPVQILTGAERPFYQTVTCARTRTLVVLRDLSTTATIEPNRIRGLVLGSDGSPSPIFPVTSSHMYDRNSIRPLAVASDGEQFVFVMSHDEDRQRAKYRLVSATLAAGSTVGPTQADALVLPDGSAHGIQLVRTTTGYLAVWPYGRELQALWIGPQGTFVDRLPFVLATAPGPIDQLTFASGGDQIALLWTRPTTETPTSIRRVVVLESVVLSADGRHPRQSQVASVSDDLIGNIDIVFDGQSFVVLWRQFELDPSRGTVREDGRPRSQLVRMARDGRLLDPTPLEGPQIAGFGRFELDSNREGQSLLFYASGDDAGSLATSRVRARVLAPFARP
jgi:hypothetical protein